MPQFLSADYAGPPFVMFGTAHIAALAALGVLNIVLIRLGRVSARSRAIVRTGLAATLWIAESSWHLWNLAVGTWTPQTMLPLNLCSLLIWLCGVMLLQGDSRIYEFAYFLGIGGAIQYLLTPDLGQYGFPHFRFFQTFTSHGLLLTAPVFMTVAEGFRPTWKSIRRVVIGTNLYMFLIFLLNSAIGSNYLMLNAKPVTPSLLDLLPPWPCYIPFMELIGVSTCLLLFLPFLVADRRAARARPGNESSTGTDSGPR